MTIEEYNRLNKLAEAKQNLEEHQKTVHNRENADEIASKRMRQRLVFHRPQPTKEQIKKEKEERESYQPFEEPGSSAPALGKWQTVEYKEEKYVDLQLPEQPDRFEYEPPVQYEPEPPVRQFKEKTITILNDEDTLMVPDSFKKRKFGNAKRNARQRLDDD